uniref:Uncharacterized protein n=1 Tax=viral metagenome TaxID=1070528 RepID=A0A6C0AC06_9ZZZZ
MFLVDKYSPTSIDDASFHKDILEKLSTISKDDAVPHTVFYGPEGGGKKTLIYLFLQMIYDKSVYNLQEVAYNVEGSGNNEKKVVVKQSNYHIVIEPNNNNSDRYLIQGVLKEYVKKVPLNVFNRNRSFKTVLINNVDNLSYYTQTALRRMMELYSGTCRFILWCRSLNKVIDPIVSRCLSVRVNCPSDNEILKRAFHVACLENINLDLSTYNKIVKDSKGNFKTCLWLINLKKYGYSKLNVYQEEIETIGETILECNIKTIPKIRDMLYKIVITNVDGIILLKDIMDYFLNRKDIDDKIKLKIIEITAEVEFNLKRGRREIIHLDHFIQHIVYWIKKYKREDKIKPKKVTQKLTTKTTKTIKPVKKIVKDTLKYKVADT